MCVAFRPRMPSSAPIVTNIWRVHVHKFPLIRSSTLWAVAGLLGLVAILPILSGVPALSPRTVDAATVPTHLQNSYSRIASGTTVSVTFPTSNVAGNTIVAYAMWSELGTVSVADSQGNTYTGVSAPNRWKASAWSAQVLYASKIKAGSNTVTATFTAPIRSFGLLYIHEYSGIDPTTPIDGTSAAAGTSGTMNSGAITTSNVTDLLFSAAGSDNTVTSAGSGYTVRSTGRGNMTADMNVSASGQYSAGGNQNGSAWTIQVVALRAAGPIAPTQTPVKTATFTPVPVNTATPTRTPTNGPAATPAFVQANFIRISSGNTVNVGLPASSVAGNTIVAYVLWSETGSVALADSRGNAYVAATAPTLWSGNTSSAQIFYAKNIAGGSNTVTATFTSAIRSFGLLYVHEYSGLDRANPLDATRSAAGAGGSLDSGAITTSNASDLLFSAAASDNTVNSTGTGYAIRSTGQGNLTSDKNVTTIGQYNASGTHNGWSWVIQVVAMRAAGSGAPSGTATPTQTPTQTPVATLATTAVPTATPIPSGPATYPLKVSANGRYLVDQNNKPFLMVGDSPQSIIGNISEADADLYFANRQANGFNTVWINLLCNSYTYCNSDGTTFDGIRPFTTPGDLSTPNEAYFTKVDHVLQLAANHGIVVFLDPIETGGWLGVAKSNGTTKVTNYGKYIGNRYKNFSNIVWQHGNDFQSWQNASDDAVIRAAAQGIKATDPNHLATVELNYYQSGSQDDSSWLPLINLDAAYTYYPTYDQVLKEYNRAGMPTYMVEANYEFEHNANDATSPNTLRRQEYWTQLSGATGQIYGNLYTVRFSSGWKSQLDTTGARQLAYGTALFAPRQWYNLVPDQAHTVVTAGFGTYNGGGSLGSNDYATTARTLDGKLVMTYMPTTRTITVDMTKLSGPVLARWYDPANGTFKPIAGSPFANTGSRQFTPPGNNDAGDGDWVLVLES